MLAYFLVPTFYAAQRRTLLPVFSSVSLTIQFRMIRYFDAFLSYKMWIGRHFLRSRLSNSSDLICSRRPLGYEKDGQKERTLYPKLNAIELPLR